MVHRRPTVAVFVEAMARVATQKPSTRDGDASPVLPVRGNCTRDIHPGKDRRYCLSVAILY